MIHATRTAVLCLVVLSIASPALAQTSFVYGQAGGTFRDQNSVIFAGGVGGGGEVVQGFGEFGRIKNVLPGDLEQDLNAAFDFLEFLLGVPITVDLNVPATYGVRGVRITIPVTGRVHPYIEGGGGFARLTIDLRATVAGIDITQDILDELGEDDSATEGAMVIGGGVVIDVTDRVFVDGGYRYMRIFSDEAVNVNNALGRVGFRF